MALRPWSRSERATSVRSRCSRRFAALMSIGRLTPVTTSTLFASRNVIPRFDGVPPNISVASSTPSGPCTRAIAAAISSRASCTSSCQPMDTAVKVGRSPTMVSVAFTSSVASCPWVTTTTPIIAIRPEKERQKAKGTRQNRVVRYCVELSFCLLPSASCLSFSRFPPKIPMSCSCRDALQAGKLSLQRLREIDRPVASTRAADGDRQVGLPFLDVVRHHVFQKSRQPPGKVARGAVAAEIRRHHLVLPGFRAQAVDKMRVGQKPAVEHEIRVERHAVLVAEALEGEDEPRPRMPIPRHGLEDVTELVHRQIRGGG